MAQAVDTASGSVTRDDVTLTPVAAKGAGFEPVGSARYEPEMPAGPRQPFLPPEPERVSRAGARMPRIEELPAHAQKQLRAHRGENEGIGGEARSFLRKLATVGFGRRDETAPSSPEPILPPSLPEPIAQEPSPRALSANDYAKRSAPGQPYRVAQGGLDQQGRAAPLPRSNEEDQLEIPAFLRRHSS